MKVADIPANETQRLRSLYESGLLGAAPSERFDRLTRLAQRIFDVPMALVSLVDANKLWLTSGAQHGLQETPRDVSFCSHTILSSEPLVVHNALADNRFADNPLVAGPPYIRFYAGCPVRMPDGMNIGAFCLVDHQARQFPSHEVMVLRDLASIVEDEFAVLNAASTDELTGLNNRRGLTSIGHYALLSAARRRETMSLVYIDLDKFKQINDTWGHQAGDNALTAMAAMMKTTFREADVVARLGGDEFCLLLPGMSEEETTKALQRLSQTVADWNHASGHPWQLRFSWGSASCHPDQPASLDGLIKAADARMYQMKVQRQMAR
ncbi:sensor domain-containing diguanylate cyclase [Entomohabitans teleogrylli]|uniref:sensor domain-containing diguanylate cyclase n=1 Tax=Entomohabitans teleogrylli TaxID=1384589 RepID=UPI00073D5374|nr:sensor domain-containing diguanylate cyclase [Entomohabitans teleogrylli]